MPVWMPHGAGWALHACSATAPTTLAALWLARAGKQVCIEDPGLLAGGLAPLPIGCTAWDPDKLRTLRAMGVTAWENCCACRARE